MTEAGSAARAPLVWECDVPLLTHPAILRSLATLWAVTALVMIALVGGIVAATEGPRAVAPLAGVMLMVTGGLFVLSLVVVLVVFGNRLRMAFAIDGRGVVARMIDRRGRAANRLAILAGLAAGRPGLAGAGLIARGGEERRVVWRGVAGVRYDARRHTITLRNAWRPVLHVFCTPQTYEAAAARVAAGLAAVRGRPGRRRNPLWTTLGLTAGVVLAVAPLFAMPYPFAPDLFAVIFTLCFALATVWLVPLMAWPVLAGVAWLGGTILLQGLATRTNRFTGETYSGFGSLDGGEWVGLAATLAGLAALAGLAVAALRGRLPSLLMRDTLEMTGEDGT